MRAELDTILREVFPSGRYSDVAEIAWDRSLPPQRLASLLKALASAFAPIPVVAEAPNPITEQWAQLRDSRSREIRIPLQQGPSWLEMLRMPLPEFEAWLEQHGPYRYLNISISRLAAVWLPTWYMNMKTDRRGFVSTSCPTGDAALDTERRVREVLKSFGLVELVEGESSEEVPWVVWEPTGVRRPVTVYDCLIFSDLD